MCIGDWRLGRLIKSQLTQYTNLLTTPVTIPASMQRVAVNISLVSPLPIGVTNVQVTIDGVRVFYLGSILTYINYDTLYYGDLSTKAFTLTGSSDATFTAVIQWFLPEDVLQSGLEMIRSEYKL